MRYLSLFTGIGGFELGIQQAYDSFNEMELGRCRQEKGYLATTLSDIGGESYKRQYPNCVGYSEIDKYATQIYQHHFPNHTNYGDITKIDPATLPDFDLLVGGFPCQAFSIAGKRLGFADTRGTLFFDIARILKEKHPRLFLLENVKGLLSHDNGNTFKTIITTLNELGYDLQWQVLNSKNHGVPQNRERVFIVGHLRGTPRPEVFPFTGGNPKNLEQLIGGHQGNRVYGTGGVSTTIASQAGGQGAKTGLYVQNPKMMNYKKDFENSVAITATSYKEPPVVSGIRRLTPTECERLQGFPDGWTEGVSDTQRYKTLGNAVTVNVIRDIMPKLIHN